MQNPFYPTHFPPDSFSPREEIGSVFEELKAIQPLEALNEKSKKSNKRFYENI